MSIDALNAVFGHSTSKGAALAVLTAIADHVNTTSGYARPGIERIAKQARVDRRTVYRALDVLEAAGELTVERRPGKPSLYRITLPGIATADPVDNHPQGVTGRHGWQDATGGSVSQRGDTSPQKGWRDATQTLIEPLEPKTATETVAVACPACGQPDTDPTPAGIYCHPCEQLYPPHWQPPAPLTLVQGT